MYTIIVLVLRIGPLPRRAILSAESFDVGVVVRRGVFVLLVQCERVGFKKAK